MQPINFVFDIDDTIVVHFDPKDWEENTKEIVELYGEKFLNKHTVWAVKYPHFVFPGIPTLWKWLYSQGHRIAMFSSAVKERNEELANNMVKLIFQEKAEEVRPQIKVFSRTDCFDTSRLKNYRDFQPVFFGNYKKVLAGVVVPPEELPWSFLIDDDRSYMALHEEYNLIKVVFYTSLTPLSSDSFRNFTYCFKAFYLAGLFQAIFEMIENDHITAVEAAKTIQVDNANMPFDHYFSYPTTEDYAFFEKGEKILKNIDPEAIMPPKIHQMINNHEYEK